MAARSPTAPSPFMASSATASANARGFAAAGRSLAPRPTARADRRATGAARCSRRTPPSDLRHGVAGVTPHRSGWGRGGDRRGRGTRWRGRGAGDRRLAGGAAVGCLLPGAALAGDARRALRRRRSSPQGCRRGGGTSSGRPAPRGARKPPRRPPRAALHRARHLQDAGCRALAASAPARPARRRSRRAPRPGARHHARRPEARARNALRPGERGLRHQPRLGALQALRSRLSDPQERRLARCRPRRLQHLQKRGRLGGAAPGQTTTTAAALERSALGGIGAEPPGHVAGSARPLDSSSSASSACARAARSAGTVRAAPWPAWPGARGTTPPPA